MTDQGLVMRGITVTFDGFAALDSVSIEARPGEVLGIIGPNSAGKTTLLNVVCGLAKPDAGSVTWAGREYSRIKPKQVTKLGIARTPQVLGPLDEGTVLESVMAGADRRPSSPVHNGRLGRPPSAREERALLDRSRDLMRELDIARYAAQPPATLPHAVRKRISLARALIGNPRLLLLDELADGLSAVEAAGLGAMIRGLARRMTVILVEHHLDLVLKSCDHVVVLDGGRVIADGSSAQIMGDPLVRAAYLDHD